MTLGLDLNLAQLREVADILTQRISQGLQADDQEIGCLPTYLDLPTGRQSGNALVVDTGGTNTRAALVELLPLDGHILAGPNSRKVPDGREGAPLSADFFFAAQAEMAVPFERTSEKLPLGYCFSYPAQATEDGDAILLRWTKGLQVESTLGEKVGTPLKKALEHNGYQISSLRVLNDTVASLLGGVHLYAEERFGRNYIGLIMGTGTNMAGVFRPEQVTKLGLSKNGKPSVINLESGNFSPPFLTPFDDLVDKSSNNPGMQRFEKAVSGHYLPLVFNAIHPGIIDPADGSGRLVELRDRGSGESKRTAGLLLSRSAKMAAAAIAGLCALYPAGDTAVLGEGSLLWGDPQYADCLRNTLFQLMPDRDVQLLRQRDNVNLLGAACAALAH